MSATPVLDEVETLLDDAGAPGVLTDAQAGQHYLAKSILAHDAQAAQAPEEELSEEEDDDNQCQNAALAALPEPRQPKARPRRKRHVVGLTADGKCELLYVDLRSPGVAEEIHAKFKLIPGTFRRREYAEWYIANAANLPSVKTARDAERAFKAEKALVQG